MDPDPTPPGHRSPKEGAPAEGAGRPADLRSVHLWHLQPVRDLLLIGAVAGAVYAGYAMRTVTVPLLIALTLAYLFEPIVSRMARWRNIGRPVSVTLILASLAVVVVAAFAFLVPLAVGQTLAFAENLREGRYDRAVERMVDSVPEPYREDVRIWAERLVHPDRVGGAPVTAEDSDEGAVPKTDSPEEPLVADAGDSTEERSEEPGVQSALQQLGQGITSGSPLVNLIGLGAGQVYAFALTVLKLGLVIFLIPFYFYYFSVYWPSIVGFCSDFVPDERRPKVFELVREMDRAVAGFVRGRIVICILMGVMFAIGWQLCGVPYGIALGLMTGAFSIVPYLGGVGVPFAVGFLVVEQFGLPEEQRMALWAMLLWPTLVFVIVQTIEGYALTPIIAGKATNLDPVTIVVAILAGGSVAGVYGMLLAIPLAACGKIAAKRLLLPRVRAWARGRASDPLPLDNR